jgi:hypothetical protein
LQTWWSKSEIGQTWRRSCQLRIPKLQISTNPQQQQNKIKTATSRRVLLTSLISHGRIWRRPNTEKKKKKKTECSFQICRTLSYANSKFANLMMKVGNQSDLKKKKKLPTSNSETSNLCKPTTTIEVNFSRTDLKKTQHWKKKPNVVSKFVEPFLMLTRNLQTWWWKSEISQTWRRRKSCQLRIPKLQISANPQQQQKLISHGRIWRRPNTKKKINKKKIIIKK